MTGEEIDVIMALKTKYRLELNGCPDVILRVIRTDKPLTLEDAVNELGFVADVQHEIEARRTA